jgi:hypothetical protein
MMNLTQNFEIWRQSNYRLLWLVVALFCTALFSFPFWICLYFQADFTNFANEPMAYRYFFCERVRDGESIIVGVGYLLNMFNQCAYWLTEKWLSLESVDLRSRVNLFACWSQWIVTFLVLIVYCAVALSRRLDGTQKLLVFLIGLVPVFGFGFNGFLYAQMPDYTRLNMVLAPSVIFLFFTNWSSRREAPKWWWLALTPLLLGVFAANKITLAALAPVVMMPLFLACRPSLSVLFIRGIIAVLAFALGFVLVHWLAFLGRMSALFDIAPGWFAFVANPGVEPEFWSTTFWTQIKTCNYGILSTLFPVAFITTGILVLRKKPVEALAIASLGVIFLTVLFYIYTVFKRPAGSTLWEATQWPLCLATILLGMVSKNPVGRIVSLCYIAIIFAVCLVTFPYQSFSSVSQQSRPQADIRYAFFQRTLDLAQGKRIVIIFPNNDYHHEGPHELLLKGASKFPSWQIEETGMKVIRKYAGNIEFRSECAKVPALDEPIDPDSILIILQKSDDESSNIKKYMNASRFTSLPGISREDWNLSGVAPGKVVSASIFYFSHSSEINVP